MKDDSARTVGDRRADCNGAAETPSALLNSIYRATFSNHQLWPAARSTQGHGYGLTARKLFPQYCSQKR